MKGDHFISLANSPGPSSIGLSMPLLWCPLLIQCHKCLSSQQHCVSLSCLSIPSICAMFMVATHIPLLVFFLLLACYREGFVKLKLRAYTSIESSQSKLESLLALVERFCCGSFRPHFPEGMQPLSGAAGFSWEQLCLDNSPSSAPHDGASRAEAGRGEGKGPQS